MLTRSSCKLVPPGAFIFFLLFLTIKAASSSKLLFLMLSPFRILYVHVHVHWTLFTRNRIKLGLLSESSSISCLYYLGTSSPTLSTPSTVRAYSMSLTRLDRWGTLMPTVGSRQKVLAETGRSLASDAASSAIELGQLEAAVELLEQGRAILWSQLRGYRQLEELRHIDGELARHFEHVGGEFERLAMFSDAEPMAIPLGSDPDPSVSYERKMQRHRILSEEWDTVVERIRQIDGFANFLQPVPFTTLQSAAADGPVILVNISEYRSDAVMLIVRSSSAFPEPRPTLFISFLLGSIRL
jgi:hypothetical protein